MSAPILIFGGTGQLGLSFQNVLKHHKESFLALKRSEANFENPGKIEKILNEVRPEIILNAAAYTNVNAAEDEKEKADLINAVTPWLISKWCEENQKFYVGFSTDYVYSDKTEMPLSEETPTLPLNEYGRSKLRGDLLVSKSKSRWLIFRTSWVYHETGRNFVLSMLKLAQEKKEIKVIDDQWGSPTYALDLAERSWECVTQSLPHSGIYHLANAGFTTWAGLAKEVFSLSAKKEKPSAHVIPISTAEYPAKVERPLNSRLDQSKIQKDFGVRMRPWQEALSDCMEKIL